MVVEDEWSVFSVFLPQNFVSFADESKINLIKFYTSFRENALINGWLVREFSITGWGWLSVDGFANSIIFKSTF